MSTPEEELAVLSPTQREGLRLLHAALAGEPGAVSQFCDFALSHYDDDMKQLTSTTLTLETALAHVPGVYRQQYGDDLPAIVEQMGDTSQRDVDAICYYRNLAVRLGATPNDMRSSHDRSIAERGLGEGTPSLDDERAEIRDSWEENERLEQMLATNREVNEAALKVAIKMHDSLKITHADISAAAKALLTVAAEPPSPEMAVRLDAAVKQLRAACEEAKKK